MTDFDDLEAWARNMRGSFLAATTHDEQLAVFDRVLRRLVTAELRLADTIDRADEQKYQRQIEIGGSAIGGGIFGVIFLFGAWLHGAFMGGLLALMLFSISVILFDVTQKAYKWWKGKKQ
jgi:hypothetical protein